MMLICPLGPRPDVPEAGKVPQRVTISWRLRRGVRESANKGKEHWLFRQRRVAIHRRESEGWLQGFGDDRPWEDKIVLFGQTAGCARGRVTSGTEQTFWMAPLALYLARERRRSGGKKKKKPDGHTKRPDLGHRTATCLHDADGYSIRIRRPTLSNVTIKEEQASRQAGMHPKRREQPAEMANRLASNITAGIGIRQGMSIGGGGEISHFHRPRPRSAEIVTSRSGSGTPTNSACINTGCYRRHTKTPAGG